MPDTGLLLLVARLLVGGAFIFSGVGMARNVPFVAGFLAAKGVPLQRFVALSGIAIELVLGAMMILGLYLPYVSLALAVFIVAATIMCHAFWKAEGAERAMEINHMVSNTIIVGGLLAFAAATL